MIEDIYLDPLYWLLFLMGMLVFRTAVGFRILDFKFIIGMYFAQYIAHLTLIFGLSDYLLFCSLFFAAFIFGYRGYAAVPNLVLVRGAERDDIDKRVVLISKAFLFSYYVWRISTVPIWVGALDLATRLEKQQENRALFFLGIVMVPLFVAFMYDCVRKGKFGWSSRLLIVITALGALSTGSKITILPLILSYIGVSAYLGRRIRISPRIVFGIGAGIATIFVMLLMYFPFLSLGEILDMMLYRVVANTDNLEYLYTLNVAPSQYPFSGVISIVPFVSKVLGAQIDYPYGVWLHGMRFGDWTGFGPNAGFLAEQYGNLSWGGLVVGLGLGALVRWTERSHSAFRAMILSFSYTLLVESTVFFMSLFFCIGVLFLAYALNGLIRTLFRKIDLPKGGPSGAAIG
jgi:hypothetical protein